MSKMKQYVLWNFYVNTLQTILIMISAGLAIFNVEVVSYIAIAISLFIIGVVSFYFKRKFGFSWSAKNTALKLASDERERDILTKVNAELMQTYVFIVILAVIWGMTFFSDPTTDIAFSKAIFIVWIGLAFFLPGLQFKNLWYKYDQEN